jgi:hypothetical protein
MVTLHSAAHADLLRAAVCNAGTSFPGGTL